MTLKEAQQLEKIYQLNNIKIYYLDRITPITIYNDLTYESEGLSGHAFLEKEDINNFFIHII